MKISENMVAIMAHLLQEGKLMASQIPSEYRPAVNIYIQKKNKSREEE